MKIFNISIIIILVIIVTKINVYPENSDYIWPLSINNGYSASFQEFRGNHFHAGIDLRTFQRTGYPVFTVKSGKIFKIRSVRRGGGNGVYIKHENGFTSIYYHLEKFNPYLMKILKRVRKSRGKYFGNYILKKPLKVKKGTLIGYSGETGSGFPHLHLEIRDRNYNAINPFKLLPFPYPDRNAPIIKKLILRSIGDTKINNRNGEVIIENKKFKASDRTKAKVMINGEFELVLNAIDISDTGRYVSPYMIDAYLNNECIFKLSFDKFSHNDNNQLGFVYDMFYTTYSDFYFNIFSQKGYSLERVGADTEKIFKMLKPGMNSLIITAYDNFGNNEKIDLNIVKIDRFPCEKKVDNITVNKKYLSDKTDIEPEVYINRDKISFKIHEPEIAPKNISLKVRSGNELINLVPVSESGGVFFTFEPFGDKTEYICDFSFMEKGKLLSMFRKRYKFIVLKQGSSREIVSGDFKAYFGENSVYQPKVISISTVEFNSQYPVLSQQVKVYPYNFPFLDKVYFSFNKMVKNPRQAGIFRYSFRKKKWKYTGTSIGRMKTKFFTKRLSGGVFALMRDIFPPKISFRYSKSVNGKKINNMYIYITDKGKGVEGKSISLIINKRTVQCEYDPDRKWVKIDNPGKLFKTGKNILKVSVNDRGGNFSEKSLALYLK